RFTVTHSTPWPRPRVAFRPDGRLLLAVASEVNEVRAWDPDTGSELPVPLPKEPSHALAFSPDGSLLAMAREKEIEIWDTNGCRLRRRLAAHGRSVDALAFAPNGPRFRQRRSLHPSVGRRPGAGGADPARARRWRDVPGVHRRQPTARVRRQGTVCQGLGR